MNVGFAPNVMFSRIVPRRKVLGWLLVVVWEMRGGEGKGKYLAFSGDGDESVNGREEKSGKVVVLLKSGRGDMVTELTQYSFSTGELYMRGMKQIKIYLKMF